MVVAGGDADIARDAFGEGVLAFIQPAAIKGETDGLHDLQTRARWLAGANLPVIGSAGVLALDLDALRGSWMAAAAKAS